MIKNVLYICAGITEAGAAGFCLVLTMYLVFWNGLYRSLLMVPVLVLIANVGVRHFRKGFQALK
jgi:hypothetical protein